MGFQILPLSLTDLKMRKSPSKVNLQEWKSSGLIFGFTQMFSRLLYNIYRPLVVMSVFTNSLASVEYVEPSYVNTMFSHNRVPLFDIAIHYHVFYFNLSIDLKCHSRLLKMSKFSKKN